MTGPPIKQERPSLDSQTHEYPCETTPVRVSDRLNSSRMGYSDIPEPKGPEVVACAGHVFGQRDEEYDWGKLRAYLKDGVLPKDLKERKKLVNRARTFIFVDERLWRIRKGKIPQMVVEAIDRRKDLISQAHNDCGHRGRDATYL
ncbi:hypothetical protein JAAARDRAFT_138811, partial [Jaapia argillacea MUCL 33604]